MRWSLLLLTLILAGCATTERVGSTEKGTLLPTGYFLDSPGKRLEIPGRPVDMILASDGKTIVIKDYKFFHTVDASNNKLLSTADLPGGASLYGLAQQPKTNLVWVTGAGNSVHIFDIANPAEPKRLDPITIHGKDGKGNSFPCGIAFTQDGSKAIIALSLTNEVACLDTATHKTLWRTQVGVAPYGIAIHQSKIIVTEQGGPIPEEGMETALSAGTEVEIEEDGVAAAGSVSILDLVSGKSLKQLRTGLQPCSIAIDSKKNLAYIAEANNDSITILDIKNNKIQSSFECKPDSKLPFGSMPSALAIDAKANKLYVANSGNNAVGVFDLKTNQMLGQIPTDWNPYGLLINKGNLFILNNKGVGARPINGQTKPAYNSHEKNATLISLKIPGDKELKEYSATASKLAKQAQILASLERNGSSSTPEVPVPAKLGDPSKIKHVIYVIKENRTYDQMFGNLPKGEGMASLNIFTDKHIPNHRKLAQDFVQLDNYYCNGVLSADGHSWATEGNVTPYLNRAFGGFTRSYTFGNDPITYSSSGFIWDGVLAAGLTFRNYGEMDSAEPATPMNGKQIWEKYAAGEKLEFKQDNQIANLRRYSCPNYPGWNMNIPDQFRMDRFMDEFREFEKAGELPNFMILYLPQDHTGGVMTPAAHLADNDLAIGRLVEAVSNSQFWPDTAIFINEDDPQAGTDHIDGHRSVCLVVSPYTRDRGLVSNFYNQTSVLHTINRIFGISPMNQKDAGAPLMTDCFNEVPDIAPYQAIQPEQPLDEFNSKETLSSKAMEFLAKVQKIDLREREVQTEYEMDTLSRFVWHAMKGDAQYPSEWAGAHAKGLKSRGLTLADITGIDLDD